MAHIMAALGGREAEEQMVSWEAWLQQPDQLQKAAQQSIRSARQSCRALRCSIDAATTAIDAVMNEDHGLADVHLAQDLLLHRFPCLLRLCVSLGWVPPEGCRLHLDDVPHALRELRVDGPKLWMGKLELCCMPSEPRRALTALKLSGISLFKTGLPLHNIPCLEHLVLEDCSNGGHALDIDLSCTPGLTQLSISKSYDLSSIDLSKAPKLSHLTIRSCGVPDLKLALPGGMPRTALTHLDVSADREHRGRVDILVDHCTHWICDPARTSSTSTWVASS